MTYGEEVLQSGKEWSTKISSWEREADKEEPVGNRPKSTANSPIRPSLTILCAVFTSLVAVKEVRQTRPSVARALSGQALWSRGALKSFGAKRRHLRTTNRELIYVSRQSPSSGRRKGTIEDPGRVQAGDRREVRTAILHHQPGWEGCTSVSLRGMGADREEAGRALHFQSYEEKVSGPGELLRADGGDGRSGAAADAATAAGSGANQGRGCGYREFDAPDRTQPGFLPPTGRGRKVYA